MNKGIFIVLDGPDGCGKTTQAELLCAFLKARNCDVLHIREPGGTRIGEKIRDILLSPEHAEMAVTAELFLYMASRAQLVEEVIKPALLSGKIVISERFLSSSIVYQGIAGGLGKKNVEDSGRLACQGVKPDVIFILDIAAREGLVRIKRGLDRMERKQLTFHEQVRRGFLSLAKENPRNVKIIDSSGSIEQIHLQIRQYADKLICRKGRK